MIVLWTEIVVYSISFERGNSLKKKTGHKYIVVFVNIEKEESIKVVQQGIVIEIVWWMVSDDGDHGAG